MRRWNSSETMPAKCGSCGRTIPTQEAYLEIVGLTRHPLVRCVGGARAFEDQPDRPPPTPKPVPPPAPPVEPEPEVRRSPARTLLWELKKTLERRRHGG